MAILPKSHYNRIKRVHVNTLSIWLKQLFENLESEGAKKSKY